MATLNYTGPCIFSVKCRCCSLELLCLFQVYLGIIEHCHQFVFLGTWNTLPYRRFKHAVLTPNSLWMSNVNGLFSKSRLPPTLPSAGAPPTPSATTLPRTTPTWPAATQGFPRASTPPAAPATPSTSARPSKWRTERKKADYVASKSLKNAVKY